MKRLIKRSFEFLRLIDCHDGLVSLTNVQLLVVLFKLATAPVLGVTEVGQLFVSLLSFQGKKLLNKGQSTDSGPDQVEQLKLKLEEQIQDLNSRTNAIGLKIGLAPKKSN